MIVFVFSMAQKPVKEYGKLQVIGTQLSDSKGNPVVLRGVSLGWHNYWPRFFNKEVVKWLKKDWNINILRVSMGVDLDENCYLSKPEESKKIIENAIDGAIQQGIYVIIDWHSHNIHQKEAIEFFTEMAQKYAKYPNVIYEIFNEPDDESWAQVKEYSEKLIDTIRKYDKDNVILVGCPRWDQDIHLPAQDPILGQKNIMYTVHYYAATHTQWLRDRTTDAIKKGIPVFISESAGMEATGDGKMDYAEWQKWIDFGEENKLSWITWSISDKDETCSMLEKSASSKGKWKQSDLKISGIKTREYLRKMNPQK